MAYVLLRQASGTHKGSVCLAVELNQLLGMLFTESIARLGLLLCLLLGLQQIENAIVLAQVMNVKVEETCLIERALLVCVSTYQRFSADPADSVAAPEAQRHSILGVVALIAYRAREHISQPLISV
jgi:hypothetical protein